MPRAFAPAYLAGEREAAELLPPVFRDGAARVARLRRAQSRRAAAEVLTALERREAELPPSPARRANLAALAAPGTAAVVTGQQIGLFLGPLFTFYKAASAIAVARALEAEGGGRCVPIFWLQTEDHDFAEIDHCWIPGPGQVPMRLQLLDGGPARASVKHRVLGPEVDHCLSVLASALERQPGGGEVIALLRRHYRSGRPLADAFAGVIASLFAEEGLLVLDPRDAAIAARVTPVYRRALDDCDGIARALEERGEKLRRAGFEEQVHPRRSSLLFFHHPTIDGPRHRLERAEGGWLLAGAGRTIPEREVAAALANEPLRFSTSALLRPLVQDALLPTAAYVGGPGELGYFAQLGALYPRFDLELPLVISRARFRCLDLRAAALLRRLGLAPADVEAGREALLTRISRRPAGLPHPEALEGALGQAIAGVLDPLEGPLPRLDANLTDALQRTRATFARAASRFTGRYRRSLLEADRIAAARADRLEALLHPQDKPQERFYGFPWFAARVGLGRFKEAVLSAVKPYDPTIQDLQP
jgi:bacillithiol biosynthesis cysteine-adding enzyme BshC